MAPTPVVPVAEGLSGLRVVDRVAEVAGYERSCRRGKRCVFGPAWSDDVDVAYGHDGCSTRDNVLAEQLSQVRVRPGTRGCVVEAGTLLDPYTGRRVEYRKGDPSQPVEVDHVASLSSSWDRGAAGWTAQRRQDFANDPRNLLATTAAANGAKSDKTPAEWRPDTREGRCLYATRFIEVSAVYDLVVTRADVAALQRMLRRC